MNDKDKMMYEILKWDNAIDSCIELIKYYPNTYWGYTLLSISLASKAEIVDNNKQKYQLLNYAIDMCKIGLVLKADSADMHAFLGSLLRKKDALNNLLGKS